MLRVPGVLPLLAEFSYHRYQGVSSASLAAIAERGARHGVATAMLEHIGSDYRALHNDLKDGANSAWQQFALAFPEDDNGAQYYPIDARDTSQPAVTLGARTRLLRHYFRYIRAGAVRIEASSSAAALDPVAFVNANGSFVVVIKADTAGTFTVQGLPAATYGIRYTSGTQHDVDAGDVTLGPGQAVTSSIPGPGVVTIYGKPEPATPATSQRRLMAGASQGAR
jgi:hypothetical protein